MRNKRDVSEHIKAKVQHVCETICKLRTDKGVTREKLAYGIGIAKSYLGYIERGQANPTLETLLLIAEGLDTSVSKLTSS